MFLSALHAQNAEIIGLLGRIADATGRPLEVSKPRGGQVELVEPLPEPRVPMLLTEPAAPQVQVAEPEIDGQGSLLEPPRPATSKRTRTRAPRQS